MVNAHFAEGLLRLLALQLAAPFLEGGSKVHGAKVSYSLQLQKIPRKLRVVATDEMHVCQGEARATLYTQ